MEVKVSRGTCILVVFTSQQEMKRVNRCLSAEFGDVVADVSDLTNDESSDIESYLNYCRSRSDGGTLDLATRERNLRRRETIVNNVYANYGASVNYHFCAKDSTPVQLFYGHGFANHKIFGWSYVIEEELYKKVRTKYWRCIPCSVDPNIYFRVNQGYVCGLLELSHHSSVLSSSIPSRLDFQNVICSRTCSKRARIGCPLISGLISKIPCTWKKQVMPHINWGEFYAKHVHCCADLMLFYYLTAAPYEELKKLHHVRYSF